LGSPRKRGKIRNRRTGLSGGGDACERELLHEWVEGPYFIKRKVGGPQVETNPENRVKGFRSLAPSSNHQAWDNYRWWGSR